MIARHPAAEALGLMLLAQTALTFGQYAVPVMAPDAAAALGVSPALIGLYTGAIYVASVVGALWGGNLVSRLGPVRVTQLCLLVLGGSLFLFATPVLAVVAVSALVMGLGYGPATPASSDMLTRRTPERLRNFVFSLKQAGVPLGGALAGVVVPPLVLGIGWRNTALLLGALLVVLAAVYQPYRRAYDDARRPGVSASLARRFRDNFVEPLKIVVATPRLHALAWLSFVFGGCQLSLTSFLVVYLTADVAYSLVLAGLALSCVQIAGVLARPAWGWIADRFVSPGLVLVLIAAIMAVCGLLTAAIRPDWPQGAVLALMVVYGCGVMSWTGVYLAEVARLAPREHVGRATGGALVLTFGGSVFVPPLFAAIAVASGTYRWGFVGIAVLAAAGGLVFARIAGLKR